MKKNYSFGKSLMVILLNYPYIYRYLDLTFTT